VITYTYDPLYQLTGAYYDNGFSFLYQYDSAGNRTERQECLNGFGCNTTTYTYDIANRLATVDDGTGPITYQWDNKGNLLNDGTSNYTYTAANRLSSVTGSSFTSSYAYNGLGDRLSQTTEYFLTDALVSVRQMVDETGELTLAQAYLLMRRR
jgi:YD repeat-containing protein